MNEKNYYLNENKWSLREESVNDYTDREFYLERITRRKYRKINKVIEKNLDEFSAYAWSLLEENYKHRIYEELNIKTGKIKKEYARLISLRLKTYLKHCSFDNMGLSKEELRKLRIKKLTTS